jgi:hypothetical protein
MGLKGRAGVALVLGCALLSCERQVVDHEARKYVRDELAPYLDSIAYQLCQIKYSAAPATAGRLICPGLNGWPMRAPLDGSPGELSDKKDSEVRRYIRDELEPYLDSLTYQLCHIKSRAAPAAPGRLICPGPPEGYKKPPGNGDP